MGRKKTIKLYKITGLSIDNLVDRHITLVTTPVEKVTEVSGVTSYSIEGAVIKTAVSARAKPHSVSLYHKYVFLVHLIVSECILSKQNKFQLNSKRLKAVLGDGYYNMIQTLAEAKVIRVNMNYVVETTCRKASLLRWDIELEESKNVKVMQYLSKWKKLKQKDEEGYDNVEFEIEIKFIDGKVSIEKKYKEETSPEDEYYYENYNSSLSYLQLKYPQYECERFIETLFENKQCHSYYHCLANISRFNQDSIQIQKIDEQGRVYHYLTNLKKELKKLYNIKYQVDIANSHPLLLSKILIVKYDIKEETLRIIYNKERENIENIHNVSKLLYNQLSDSNLRIPEDVIRYLYVTSKGLLWDELQHAFPDYERNEIKHLSFAHIFYNPHEIAIYTEFGRQFMSVYPNVYRAIAYVRGITNLPKILMKYESSLMKRVLTQCYSNGWKVISIHDAVVVLDVPENNECDAMAVKIIINEVYKNGLLHPTVHVDTFDL